jgi:long-subunit fatty acid transport protein
MKRAQMIPSKYIFYFLIPFLFLVFEIDVHAYSIGERVGIASSPNPVGSGARAIGMGGTFIAIAGDATAASWNPAGLVQLEKPETSIALAYQSRIEDFSSSLNPEIDNSAAIDESSINYFSASYPFALINKNMVVSINYQRLYDFKRKFDYRQNIYTPPLIPSDPPSIRKEERNYDRNGSLAALGLAYAIEVTPQISLGLTLNIWTDDLMWQNGWEETFTNHSQTTFGAVSNIENTHISDKYTGFSGINANIGALWNINQSVTIGAVLKTPFTASINHEYSENWTQSDESGSKTVLADIRDSDDIELEMPMSYGIGISYRFSDQLSMGLDIYRTEWSKFILTDGDGNKSNAVSGQAKEDSNVKDTTQIHLGGEYLILKPDRNLVIPLRAGLFYDPEPAEGDEKKFYGMALGSGIGYKNLVFDLAYQLRWGRNIEMNNLIVNSKADIMQHTVLVSLIYHF